MPPIRGDGLQTHYVFFRGLNPLHFKWDRSWMSMPYDPFNERIGRCPTIPATSLRQRYCPEARIQTSGLVLPHLPLPRRRNIKHLAILRHRAACDRIARFAELVDEVLVG